MLNTFRVGSLLFILTTCLSSACSETTSVQDNSTTNPSEDVSFDTPEDIIRSLGSKENDYIDFGGVIVRIGDSKDNILDRISFRFQLHELPTGSLLLTGFSAPLEVDSISIFFDKNNQVEHVSRRWYDSNSNEANKDMTEMLFSAINYINKENPVIAVVSSTEETQPNDKSLRITLDFGLRSVAIWINENRIHGKSISVYEYLTRDAN